MGGVVCRWEVALEAEDYFHNLTMDRCYFSGLGAATCCSCQQRQEIQPLCKTDMAVLHTYCIKSTA
jgi:hypothetical protein